MKGARKISAKQKSLYLLGGEEDKSIIINIAPSTAVPIDLDLVLPGLHPKSKANRSAALCTLSLAISAETITNVAVYNTMSSCST